MRTTIIMLIKEKIGSIAFDVFLWANNMKDNEYWNIIYEQEKEYRKEQDLIL